MAFSDRIKVNTATTGTGPLTLSATGVRDSANGDALAPAESLTEVGGRRVPYFITSGNNWASGNGLLSDDGLTLTRSTNETSWNGTVVAVALLNLTGTSTVFISPRAKDLGAAPIGATLCMSAGLYLN